MSKEAVCHLWQDWLQGDTPPPNLYFLRYLELFPVQNSRKGYCF